MIIAIDGHMIGDNSGGNESYYRNMLISMEVLPSDKVILILKEGVEFPEVEEKFEIIRFRSNGFLRYLYELNSICRKYNVDVLHTQYFIPFFRRCKVVCTIHDICFEHYKNIFTKKEYIIQKLLIPYSAKKSDHIITVSNHAKNDIMQMYGIEEKKITVTYNAVSNQFTKLEKSNHEIKETFQRKYNLSGEFILSVGNLQPRKNIPRLIKSFALWKNETNSNMKLVIVGKKAWMYDEILEVASGYSNDIIFTGYVEEIELIYLYNLASFFVYPSIYEGFGIPPLEAMACGTPVAVSNTSALPEVVGDAGIYFNPFNISDIKEKLSLLSNNPNLREKYSEKGINRAKKFDWKTSSGKLYQVYKLFK